MHSVLFRLAASCLGLSAALSAALAIGPVPDDARRHDVEVLSRRPRPQTQGPATPTLGDTTPPRISSLSPVAGSITLEGVQDLADPAGGFTERVTGEVCVDG